MPSLHRRRTAVEQRFSLTDLAYLTSYANGPLGAMSYTTYDTSGTESVPQGNFVAYCQQVAKSNGVVFACLAARARIFAQVVFRYAFINNGRIGQFYGDPSIDILSQPFGPNSSTSDLATRMISDADLAGNFYAVRSGARLWRRRPDKMTILLSGDPTEDEFVSIAGYLYYPNGVKPGGDFYQYPPEQVAHWTPIPDPEAEYRGMSWITPVLREVQSDSAATDHKLEFFDNAATPNTAIVAPESVMTKEQFDQFKAGFNYEHTGRGNRHKTLFLVPGTDIQTLGSSFSDMQFTELQGRDETRICSAAGVPAVIVGVKEALQGSSLNQGNYASARRQFADMTMRPLMASACSALSTIVSPSRSNARLWYDDYGIAFFREDQQDAAQILATQAQALRTLGDAGYTMDSATKYLVSGDPADLVHTGLFSVQLQEPGSPKLPQPGPDLADGQ